MKKSPSPTWQKCFTEEAPSQMFDAKVKCVTALVFEKSGKTVIQPLVTNREGQALQNLLQNDTLEVWLSNGETDLAQFDVAILKYKQQMQSSTMCSKAPNHVCLKNHVETIVSCEQCPLSDDGAED
jgi:hypothetical protein